MERKKSLGMLCSCKKMIITILLISIVLPMYQPLMARKNTSSQRIDNAFCLEQSNKNTLFGDRLTITSEGEEQSLAIQNIGAPIYYYFDLFVRDTIAYLVGYHGIEIFDCSNPQKPKLLSKYRQYASGGIIFVNGSFAYLTAHYYDSVGFDIVDIHDSMRPTLKGQFKVEGVINRISGLFIEDRYAYLLGYEEDRLNDEYNSSLLVIDLSDPTNPIEVGRYSNKELFIGLFVRDRFIHLLKDYWGVDNDEGLEIINASNPTKPHKIGEWSCSERPYSIYIERDLAFITNRVNGLEVIDYSDPSNPQKIAEYDYGGSDIFISGNFAYVVKGKELVILDITNPTEIKQKGKYKLIFEGNGWFKDVFIEGNFAYLLKRSEIDARKFFIIDCSNQKRPRKIFPGGRRLGAETSMFLTSLFAIIGIFVVPPIVLILVIIFSIRLIKRRRKEKMMINNDLSNNERKRDIVD